MAIATEKHMTARVMPAASPATICCFESAPLGGEVPPLAGGEAPENKKVLIYHKNYALWWRGLCVSNHEQFSGQIFSHKICLVLHGHTWWCRNNCWVLLYTHQFHWVREPCWVEALRWDPVLRLVAIMTVELDLCSLLCTAVLLNTDIDWNQWSSAASWGNKYDPWCIYIREIFNQPSMLVSIRAELEPAQLLAVMVME